ncbi:MAG: C40 family peptidase [Alphaproteobacteria bacterium]|nr:C40 family peptidase [Alphaproteobacteria bacterium]
MIPVLTLLLASPAALATTRQEILDRAAVIAGHTWTAGEANTAADCKSSYRSDYAAGSKNVGLPYAWGGYMDTQEFDKRLGEGQGAGSHSSDGVLSCVAGVDCSGFVSQSWGLASKQSTSTMSNVSKTIKVEELKPGDAFNRAGKHVVLFIGFTEDGEPVFQEASGGASKVRTHKGWSYLSGYTPIRYNEVTEEPLAGAWTAPLEATGATYTDTRLPLGPGLHGQPAFTCKEGSATAAGTGALLYKVTVSEPSTLTAKADTSSASIRVLSALGGAACDVAGDGSATATVCPGTWYVAVQASQGSALTTTLSLKPGGDCGQAAASTSSSSGSSGGDGGGKKGGCATTPLTGGALLWVLAAGAALRRRRR